MKSAVMKKTTTPTLQTIKTLLMKGRHPSRLPSATFLGGGAQRRAWRVGEYVVKANTRPWTKSAERYTWRPQPVRDGGRILRRDLKRTARVGPRTRRVFRACGLDVPKQIAVKHWLVQEYLTPMNWDEMTAVMQEAEDRDYDAFCELQHGPWDVHFENVGRRANGQVVVFDW